jgi:glycosyltransferase involved in cell wall biosynthesis
LSYTTLAACPLPKVSIVVPTFEQEELALEAARSALAQDYANLEVLVVDDASPTASYQALRSIADPRLRVIRNERNLGRVGNYRHALYTLASGDWVVNLDGDDFYTDISFISRAIAVAMQDPEIVIVGARCVTLSRHGRVLSPSPGSVVLSGLDLVGALPRTDLLFMHLATLYRRADALDTDFYRGSCISADWESLYRLALRGKVAFMDRDVGVWRVHGSNASGSGNWQSLSDNLRIWPTIFAEAEAAGLSPQLAQAGCRRCLSYFGGLQLPSVLRAKSAFDGLRYLLVLWSLDRVAFARVISSGKTLLRLLAGFAGYYQRRVF